MRRGFRQQLRPPIAAGIAIIVAAAAVLASIAAFGGRGASPPASVAAATGIPVGETPTVTASQTTNVRAEPERFAEVIAVLPGQRAALPLGRTADGSWVQVRYPLDSDEAGWVPASSLVLDDPAVGALPVVAGAGDDGAEVAGTPAVQADPLPDLVIANAFLLQDGRLAVGVRNIGDAPLVEALVPLNVSKASGDILGVLRVGPTTLAPGANATVLTEVTISETGNYLLELDRAGEIVEVEKGNNSYSTLLIAGGR